MIEQMQGLIDSGVVSTYRTIRDFAILSKVIADKGKQVLVVGGGFLGSELACSLSRAGSKVTQVMPENGNMGLIFPAYLVKWTVSKVEKEGVKVVG